MGKSLEFWVPQDQQYWTKRDAIEGSNSDEALRCIPKSAYDQAIATLKKTRGAMKYAYEDHVDQYYLNCLDDINNTLKNLGEISDPLLVTFDQKEDSNS